MGSALVRVGVRRHAPPESISKRAPSTTRTSLRFRINEWRAARTGADVMVPNAKPNPDPSSRDGDGDVRRRYPTQSGLPAQPLACKLLILKIRREVRVVEGARLEIDSGYAQ